MLKEKIIGLVRKLAVLLIIIGAVLFILELSKSQDEGVPKKTNSEVIKTFAKYLIDRALENNYRKLVDDCLIVTETEGSDLLYIPESEIYYIRGRKVYTKQHPGLLSLAHPDEAKVELQGCGFIETRNGSFINPTNITDCSCMPIGCEGNGCEKIIAKVYGENFEIQPIKPRLKLNLDIMMSCSCLAK